MGEINRDPLLFGTDESVCLYFLYYGKHTLKIKILNPGLRVFTFTFG